MLLFSCRAHLLFYISNENHYQKCKEEKKIVFCVDGLELWFLLYVNVYECVSTILSTLNLKRNGFESSKILVLIVDGFFFLFFLLSRSQN
jgi:hypothetical protein